MAQALVLPVVMGIARCCCFCCCCCCCLLLPPVPRPVDPMCMSDRHENSEEMFSLPLVSLLRMPPCEEEGSGDGCVMDQDTESEMGDGEEESSIVLPPPPMDATSSMPTGSNLLYLSDQVSHNPGQLETLENWWFAVSQDSSDAEELDSGGDDVSVLDYRVEEEGLIDSHSSHRSTQDSHWALPSSRPSHSSHHHHHHHSSRLSRTSNAAHRYIVWQGG